jgi:hypothetical protein
MGATATGATEVSFQRNMAEALKRFARSVELCDDYLRGYYGLKLVSTYDLYTDREGFLTVLQVTSRLLKETTSLSKPADADDFTVPNRATVERLDELATSKLAEIVRRFASQEPQWRGYDEAEIAAARELLSLKE